MTTAGPLEIPWRSSTVRVRHDDPNLGPYAPRAAVIGSAVQLGSDAEGVRLALQASVGDRYAVTVREAGEGIVVGLRRRP